MTKRLIYLFILTIALTGCHRSSYHHLKRAQDLWTVHFDSAQYHLVRIDSSELNGEELVEYYFMRMHTLQYQKGLEKEKADSISRMLVKYYPEGHKRAFKARMLRSFCCIHVLGDYPEADSLITAMRPLMRSRNDSINWYGYKVGHERRLGEGDSAILYLKEALRHRVFEESYVYAQMGEIYQQMQKNDSAIESYFRALQTNTNRHDNYRNTLKVLGLLYSLKDYDKAKQYIQHLRQWMKRRDIPYINFLEGDMWMQLHQPDSATKYYLIASEAGNSYITTMAYERLASVMEDTPVPRQALDKHIQSIKIRNDLHFNYQRQQEFHNIEALKLKNELNELKVKQQSYVILILGLGAFILILCGSFTIYLLHRKRKHLMQENLLLKQQEELSTLREKEAVLREKDARMREELFRRIRIVKDLEEGNRVHIADADWKDIHVMLESTYPGFLSKLKETFPLLTEKDINFCCLVKIRMSLQNMADVYNISVNSISRRKLRLKEKLGIDKDDSLGKFLNRFV